MEQYAVVIPVSYKGAGKGLWKEPASYFLERSVMVILSLNGPCHLSSSEVAEIASTGVVPIDGGQTANPYPARNAGMRFAFVEKGLSGVFLTDSDSAPVNGTHEAILTLQDPCNILAAGRVTTRVPDTGSTHFKLMDGLEVYDGFHEKWEPYGASMFVGRNVWETIGPMREEVPSGGDFEYAYRWRDLGLNVLWLPEMHVRKTVHGMSLYGILDKQLRRGYHKPRDYRDLDQLIDDTGSLMWDLSCIFRDSKSLEGSYHHALDLLFKTLYFMGRMASRYDRVDTCE